jgi:hypothetical protein
LQTSGLELLDDEVFDAAKEDRDERDRNESDEVLLRALEDSIQRFYCILVLPVESDRSRGMTKRRRAPEVRQDQAFTGRQFTAEVILWAIRWYLMFPVSYRDLELKLMDRGIRWITPRSSLDPSLCVGRGIMSKYFDK